MILSLRNHNDYNLNLLLEIADLARSTFYYHVKKLETSYDYDDKIIELIRRVCHANKLRYGYRRVTIELQNNYKVNINHKKVLRIMKENNLLALRKKE